MDVFDKHILKLLQKNSRITTEEIGHQVGLSATACQRRIKKLRGSGVIQKEVAVLNGSSLGGYVTVIVEIIMKQGGAKTIDEFKAQMLEHEEVQQCYYVTGNVDFILIIAAENMLKYEQLTRKLFFNNLNIQKFHSTVAMESVKIGLNIPLEP
ncbi:MAG: Lrp/AsnC family transcriptional regulator [Alteromonadaceae bacterium]|nr:Lrp/AsnC family transcriptional regulator [Alteromonadaceae bacterium]